MSWHLVVKVATHLAKKKAAQKLAEPKRGSLLRRFVVAAVIVTAPLTLVLLVVMVGVAAVVAGTPVAAAGGALGIPPVVFSAYLAAETNAMSVAADCVVDWPIVAGIWKVESDHATGRTITSAGVVTPPIYGPTLDGSIPGTAQIPDSDNGVLDGDPTWDRAVGPAQFLPGSWRAFGQDGNADRLADPHNVFDAALGTVAHLCLISPGDYTDPADLAAALRRYNNSGEYVQKVAGWIDYYRTFRFTQGAVTADGLYAFPLPVESVTVDQVRRSHHDYPASDLGVPEGTPVYAAHPGTVTAVSTPCADTQRCLCGWGVHVAGADGHTYTYCHGTQVNVPAGAEVTTGQLIMTSGNTGNSTSPHLHFQIRNPTGALVCPQPLLEAWHQGIGLSPIAAPTSGCTH
jgi:murein DD-endopeptidase MepM/ murein hydrolase activator NlpD